MITIIQSLFFYLFPLCSATAKGEMMMRAATSRRYGPPEVFQIEVVPKPVPNPNQVLIRVQTTAVNAGDWRLRKPNPAAVRLVFGFFRPRKIIMGGTVAGIVEEVGPHVKRFKVGDKVFGSTLMNFGAYAEYVTLPDTAKITRIPENISFQEAAAIPFGAMTALDFLKRARIQPGQRVLIVGASGAVGTAAVQIAHHHFGALVTAVCSGSNSDLVKSLGAEKVLDYTKPGFELGTSEYDVVFETVDSTSFAAKLKAIKPHGTIVMTDAGPGDMLRGFWASLTGKARVISGVAGESIPLMEEIAALIVAKKLVAVIDRTYPIEEMAKAHRYVEGLHKKGNVVIQVAKQPNE